MTNKVNLEKGAARTKTSGGAKKGGKRGIFVRITAVVVLGLFIMLTVSFLITTALMSLIARYWHINEDNIVAFGVVTLGISIVIGLALSFAYSAFIVKGSRPYLDALERIAECDFSVRIVDSPMLTGYGIADRFNEMADRLDSVETLREDFVSNFSHEFKTPIVSISGFAKLLKSSNLTQEERDEYLDVIIDESNRLVRLSESVLMLSRLDSQTIVNESFLLDEQIRQSILLFSRACEQKNIELEADLQEITVVNEKKLLSQIWVNLLSNAVKFTAEGGNIWVSAKLTGDKAVVSIRDNGCGMDEATQKNVFNKFFQGDRSHATEGNGLGLSVVKKICDLLKIKLELQSEQGKGTVFTVTIDGAIAKNNVKTIESADETDDKTK